MLEGSDDAGDQNGSKGDSLETVLLRIMWGLVCSTQDYVGTFLYSHELFEVDNLHVGTLFCVLTRGIMLPCRC